MTTTAGAVLAAGAGAAVAIAAPTFEPSPGSTRNGVGTDQDFSAVAAAPRAGSAASDVVIASFRTIGGGDRARGLVLRGGGTGANLFPTNEEALSDNGRATDLAVGDVDADGRQDVALRVTDGGIRVLRDKPAGFDPGAGTVYNDGESPELADLNGDGRADLVSAFYGGVAARVSNGDGTFGTLTSQIYADTAVPRIVTGQLTGDGRADVLAASGPVATLYAGQAAGQPLGTGTPVTLGQAGDSISSLAVGDVDGDGLQDIVAFISDSRISVVRRAAAGGFQAPVMKNRVGNDTGSPAAITTADVDLDGDADVITSGRDGKLKLSEATGSGAIAGPVELGLTGTLAAGVTSGDFDGDGRPDLAYLFRDFSGQQMRVLRNTTPIRAKVSAPSVSQITSSTAVVKATVTTVEPGASVRVRYGPTTAYGSESAPVTVAARQGASAVEIPLGSLEPGTAYEVQVVAENAGGATTATTAFITAAAPAPAPDTPGAPAPDTAVTIELLSPAGAPAGVAMADAPAPVRVGVSGSSGPWALSVDWGVSEGAPDAAAGVSSSKLFTHAFHAAPPIDSKFVKESGPRTAYRTVTATATDRFGRQASADKLVIVRPDTAPTAVLGSVREVLQYGARNDLVSLSQDIDIPNDAIVREQWSLDGIPRDIPFPTRSPCATAKPPAIDDACVRSPATLPYSPWEESLKAMGRGPLADVKLPSTVGVTIPEVRMATSVKRAAVLKDAARALCDLCKGEPRPKTIALTVTDRSGRTDTAERKFAVRTPEVPLADGTVVLGDGEEFVSALKADAPGLPGDSIRIDPSRSTADDGLKPAWYVLEVGTPYQTLPGSSGKCLSDDKKNPPGTQPPGLSQAELDPFLSGYPGDGFSGAAGIQGQIGNVRSQVLQGKKFGDCVKYKGDFGVKDPVVVIVTKDPALLKYTTPKAGRFAALLTVYDRYGQSDKLRFDGLDAIASSTDCIGRGFRVGAATSGVNVSGDCITARSTEDGELAWSTGPILLNGLEVAPEAGASWIIDLRGGAAKGKLYAARGVPTSPASWPKNVGDQTLAAADLRITGGAAARFRPEPRCGPVKVSGKRTAEAAKAPAFCTNKPDARELEAAASARYQGLQIVGRITMVTEKLSGNTGRSVLTFQVELPDGFGPVDAEGKRVGAAPTGLTELNGLLAVKGVVVTTTNQARAKLKRSKGKAEVYGRAAAAGRGTGKLLVQEGGLLAGFALGTPLELNIDPDTGSGTAMTSIKLGPVGVVKVQVTLTGGRLTGVDGEFTPEKVILVGGGAFVSTIRFSVQTSPRVVLTGEVTVGHNLLVPPVPPPPADAPVAVKIVGTVTVQPDPFVLTISGNAKLLDVPLARAGVVVSAAQIAISASVGTTFGPASVNATISGDVGGYGFNLGGRGSTCLGICLGVDLLVSSRGAAACGEVDLGITDVSFGFGVIYDPFAVDLYATGCSVDPYRARPSSRIISDSGGLGDGTLAAGAKKSFPVTEDLPTLIVAVKSAGGPGSAPRVILRGPAGEPAQMREYRTPSIAESSSTVTADSFADANPETGVTRFIVDRARKGTWTLEAEPSTAVGSIRLGRSVTRATRSSFGKGTAVRATSTSAAAAAVKGGRLLGTGLLGRTPKSAAKRRAIVAMAAAVKKTKRVKQAPAVKRGAAPISSAEVDTRDLRRVVRLNVAATLLPGDRVTFSERGAGILQQLGQYVVPASGRLVTELVFDPARGPERKRVIDAYVTNADGVPRGRVAAVTSYTADPLAAKDPPDVTRVERKGTTRTLVFKKGASYPKGTQPEWKLTGVGSLGTRITRMITGSDLKKGARGSARLTLKGIPKNETFKSLTVVGLTAAGKASMKGAERAASTGAKLASAVKQAPKNRSKRRR